MVDFRYHLVSIIAVFLALALGIVLGTAALNGPIQDDLNRNISRLSGDKRALEADVSELRGQLQSADAFATAVGPGLVAGDLTDQRVLIVTTDQTPSELADRLVPLLTQAGAVVTGRLRLLPALSDPSSARLVDDLVARVVPAGIDLPAGGDAVDRATSELAAALVRTPGGDNVAAGQASAIVAAFTEADLAQFVPEGDAPPRATVAVVLGAQAPSEALDDTQQAEQKALLSLATALDARSSGVVVAGPAGSADGRGLVGAVRADSSLSGAVSTVDNADRGTGLLALVAALAEQVLGGTGQYGAGPGSAGALPSSAPR